MEILVKTVVDHIYLSKKMIGGAIMDKTKLKTQSREWWMDMGVINKERGQYTEAEMYFRGAIEKDKNYGDAWFNLGSLLMRNLGKHEDALECFHQAIRCNRNDEESVCFAAEALQRLGRRKEAGDFLEKHIYAYPNHKKVLSMLQRMGASFQNHLEQLFKSAYK